VDSLVEPMAILACMLTGKPCRFVWDREEEMQVGAPRGGERWYLKDGVMNDGRIIARQFTGYFDSGAYTRLSSYAIIKGAAHLPGPYHIANVKADVFCVFTNRTPATAMRGFGVTGVDFAIECQMDKIAHEVGMNPVELRILNAYRDGDMKAHRREAKNCALIECAQVAAEKANWPIRDEFKQMSSMVGGGGERAKIPHTVTDEDGRIGDRRAGRSGGQTRTIAPSMPAPAPAAYTSPPPSAPPSRAPQTVDQQPSYVHPAAAPAYNPAATQTPSPVAPTPAPAAAPAPDSGAPSARPVNRPGYSRFASNSGFRRR